MSPLRRCLPALATAFLALGSGLAWSQGAPLGPEFRVNSYSTSNQTEPRVARSSSGAFVVVWQSYQDGSYSGIFGQRYTSSGAPIGGEFRVNSYTTNDQSKASVASDSSGNFVVVWQSDGQDLSNSGVFGQRYASSGAPLGSEFRLNSYATSDQSHPAVASAPSGTFVVVWQSYQDGYYYGIFGQRYASSGAPLGGEFQVNTFTTYSHVYPAIASDSSGNFVVVWEGSIQDGSYSGIFGQRYASTGAPLGSEFGVNTYTTNNQGAPVVASDPSGNFVVLWEGYGFGAAGAVFGQRYASSGAPRGTEFRVNTFVNNNQNRPAVASDSAGDFVVVWESSGQATGYWDVFGQRYASSGAPLGGEFRVNANTSYAPDSEYRPAVAADPSGNFVVVWTYGESDLAAYGIFGQRYGKILPVELLRFTAD